MYAEALARFEEGESLRSLGEAVGVTAERMRQVVATASRLRLKEQTAAIRAASDKA